jgi:tetratricopeptide (TPR) repeat protein
MKTVMLSILLAGVALGSAANAQDAPAAAPPVGVVDGSQFAPPETTNSSWDYSGPRGSSNPLQPGFDAIDSGNFTKAEALFARIRWRAPGDGAINFYLGAVRMDLGKWEDAKKPLEVAVRKIPVHPDPKSRLGVTYAKLGDTAGAHAQRADLVKMADACKGACELSPYIAAGIHMIDEALAETPAANRG